MGPLRVDFLNNFIIQHRRYPLDTCMWTRLENDAHTMESNMLPTPPPPNNNNKILNYKPGLGDLEIIDRTF